MDWIGWQINIVHKTPEAASRPTVTQVIFETVVRRDIGNTLMYRMSSDILDKLMLSVQKISRGKLIWMQC